MLPTHAIHDGSPAAYNVKQRGNARQLKNANKKRNLILGLFFTVCLSPFFTWAQLQITIVSPTASGTQTRSPIERFVNATNIRHYWTNILLTDSILNVFSLPDNVWIDSIAFFKVGTGHPSQPFAVGMWLGPANQHQFDTVPGSWDFYLPGKTQVFSDSSFRLDTTSGTIVFRFSKPYACWNNGLQIATRSDFGPLPTPELTGSALLWQRASLTSGSLSGTFYIGNTNTFNSSEAGFVLTNTQLPAIRIYFRNRPSHDLGLKKLLSPSFPVLKDSTSELRVLVQNEGTTLLTAAQLSYQLNQGPVVTQSFPLNLPPDSTIELSFNTPIQVPASNQFNLRVWVNDVNTGLPDLASYNDTLNQQIATAIAADTVWVGQQGDFTNLQQVINQLNAGGNTKPLTVVLTANQIGNYNWSNFSVPENRRVTITNTHPSIAIVSFNRGPLMRLNKVEGVTFSGIRFQHNGVVDSSDYLFFAERSNRIILEANRMVGSSFAARNFLVTLQNCNEITIRHNHFTHGSKALVSISDTWSKNIYRHHILSNLFNNQSTHAIHYYGPSLSDSLLIEDNLIHNTELPVAIARGIDIHRGSRIHILRNSITGHIGLYGIFLRFFVGNANQPNRVQNNLVSGNFVNAAGNALHIWSDVSTVNTPLQFVNIDHNSFQVKFTGTPALGMAPLRILTQATPIPLWSGMTIRNNLMMLTAPANANNTAAIFVSSPLDLTRTDVLVSHNHYHAPGHIHVRVNQTTQNFATLAAWRTAYPGSEFNSNVGDPLLQNPAIDNMRPNANSAVVNSGSQIPGLTLDRDGNVRDIFPDRGAFEAQPLTNSTHLYGILWPQPNSLLQHDSNYVLRVGVRNTGVNTLDSLRLSYRFGYRDTVNAIWTGSLAAGDTLLFNFPVPLRIPSDSIFVPDLRVWTNTIGGQTSPNAGLDTLATMYCTRLPAGTYEIRNTGGDTTQIQGWFRLLNCGGITGPVVMRTNFTNRVLQNQIMELGSIPGATATNRLTLDGQGDTLRMTPSSTHPTTLRLNGSKYVNVRNFVFDGAGTSTFSQIWLHNVDTVDIVHNHFRMAPSSIFNRSVYLSAQAASDVASRSTALRIDSNVFLEGMERAIHLAGNVSTPSRHLQIRHNFMRPSVSGIQVDAIDTGAIAHNDISISPIGSFVNQAILIESANGQTHINNNRIHNFQISQATAGNLKMGINISNASAAQSRVYVYNNLIYALRSSGFQYGISLHAGVNGDIAFNTIHLSDTFSTGTCFGIAISGLGSGLNIRSNNIAIEKAMGSSIGALIITSGSIASSNFNNYYLKHSSSAHRLIVRNSIGYPTLASYRQLFPLLDSASSVVDPLFEDVSAGQYSPRSLALYRNAQPLPYVTTDFNNRVRPPIPSRGAIEDSILQQGIHFTAFSQTNSITCGAIGPSREIATFTNLGSSTIDSVVVWYKKNQGPWIRDTAVYALAGRQQFSYMLGRGNLILSANDTIRAAASAYYTTTTLTDTVSAVMSNNYSPVFSLPYLNSFELPTDLSDFCITQNPQSIVQIVGLSTASNLVGQSSLGMSASSSTGWLTANADNVWTLNPNFISETSFFVNPVQASPLRLSFRLALVGGNGNNFFRVLVNGSPVVAQNFVQPTFQYTNGQPISVQYVLDTLNTGATMLITLQSAVRFPISNSPRHVNIIDSLAVFFTPGITISGFSLFTDTLCAPAARQIQLQATASLGHSVGPANLRYQADGGVWNNINMATGSTTNSFIATIPAIPGARRIRYAAIVSGGNTSWSSDTADYFNYPFDVDLGPNRSVVIGQSTTLKPKIVNAGIKTLRITEFMFNRAGNTVQASFPSGIGNQDDIIEIANYGGDTVQLRNVELAMSGHWLAFGSYRFPEGAVLPPNGRAIVTIGFTGINDFANGIYAFIMPNNQPQIYLSTSLGAVVLRDAVSKSVVDGVLINGSSFPSQMNFPAGIWTGNLSGSGNSGVKRIDLNAWSNLAWAANTTASRSNIGTIDTTLWFGPTGTAIRWKDANGQIVGTGDSLVVTPIANTLVRVEADWYGCTRQDSIMLLATQLNLVDLAITSIVNPPAVDTMYVAAPFAPAVWVKNLGNQPSGSVLLELLANGNVVSSFTLPQGINGNDSMLVTLTDWLPLQGTYNLCFRLTNTADINPANNVLCRNNIYFAVSTSVQALALHNMRIYPVPTKDQLFVQLGTAHANIDNWQWQAVDAAGRIIPLMLLSAPEGDRVELDLRPLSNGIYFLQNASIPAIKRAKFVVIH